MKICILMGALVILFIPGKLAGQAMNPSHTELTTVHVNTGTPYSITASPSRLTTATGEAASSAPPQEKTSHLAVTRPSVSEATHVTSLLSELGTVSEGTKDMISLHTTTLPSTLPMFLRHHSSLSPKSFSFTASTAVATSVPPEKGIAHTELTTTAAKSENQTDTNDLNTGTSTPAPSVPDQTTPQSSTTPTPLSSQTTYQSTPELMPEKNVEMTSLLPTLTPTQILTSEAPQTPGHLSVAPPKQDIPPQLDVGDEDTAHEGHHPASPLDPILAGLVSVFIVCTAIASVMLFLKFRHRHEHPEFHRLHDLPMDDLLEDTPLSRYTY